MLKIKDVIEILQELKEKNETYKECSENGIIENEYYKSHILLDYITNLQEENERLNMVVTIQEDYKSKNEKAIYYIWKEIEQEYDEENNKWLKEKIDKLLNKLQGVDKE